MDGSEWGGVIPGTGRLYIEIVIFLSVEAPGCVKQYLSSEVEEMRLG